MTRFAVDSSVLIPAAQVAHLQHLAAEAELQSRLDDGQEMLLPGHALVETYSVLTRLPSPLRMLPKDALESIRSFLEYGEVVTLVGAGYLDFLTLAADAGVAGGRVYDAVIAASARAAKADVILTFNVRDYAGLAPGMAVAEPDGASP